MTCPATIHIGGYFGMTLRCYREESGHKGKHKVKVPAGVPVKGDPGVWEATVTISG